MTFTQIELRSDEIIEIMRKDKISQFSQETDGIRISFKEIKNDKR